MGVKINIKNHDKIFINPRTGEKTTPPWEKKTNMDGCGNGTGTTEKDGEIGQNKDNE